MPTSQLEEWCRNYFESKFRAQFPNTRPSFLKNHKTGHNLELDGYNPEMCLAFEAQGMQHYKRVSKFQADDDSFAKQIDHDLQKQLKCLSKGVRLVVIPPLKTKDEVWKFLDMQFMNPNDLASNNLSNDLVHMTLEEKPKKTRKQNKSKSIVVKNDKRNSICVIN